MVKVPIKMDKDIEYLFDKLLEGDILYLDDGTISRRLGHVGHQLRKEKILHISTDDYLDENIAFLNKKRFRGFEKKKTRTGSYLIFEL